MLARSLDVVRPPRTDARVHPHAPMDPQAGSMRLGEKGGEKSHYQVAYTGGRVARACTEKKLEEYEREQLA